MSLPFEIFLEYITSPIENRTVCVSDKLREELWIKVIGQQSPAFSNEFKINVADYYSNSLGNNVP